MVVTSAGEMKASGLVKRYGETIKKMVPFLKKEDGKVCLYFSVLDSSDNDAVDLLRELTASSPEKIGGTTNQTRPHCLKFLRKIDIEYSYQRSSGIINVLNDVLPLVSYPHQIQIINVGSSFVREVESIIVSRINFTSNLSKLTLWRLNLTAEAASVLATSPHQAPNSHHRDLSENPLCSGVSHLAENLHHVPQLSSLKLWNVSMGDQECSSLASSLKFVPQLDRLDLSFNPLRHGVTDLANHLHSVPLLTKLHLTDTQMGEEEAGALARALNYIPQLGWLVLGSNPLGRGVSVLMEHLSSVPKLKNLYLSNVQMTKREVDDLTLFHGTSVLSDYHELDGRPYSEEGLKEDGIEYAVEGQMNSEESEGTPKLQCELPSNETGSEDETGTGQEDETGTGQEDETGTGPKNEMGTGSEAETDTESEDETGTEPEVETEAGHKAEIGAEPEAETGAGPEAETGAGPEAETEDGPEVETEAGPKANVTKKRKKKRFSGLFRFFSSKR